MSRPAKLALVGLTILLVSNVAHAAPPTAITTCGFEITTPGQYYLANDLLGCPGDGIIIAASGVRLRLDGHAIQGSGDDHGISASGQAAILIQGPGTIAGFGVGVSFVNVDFSNVIDVTATRNDDGFFVASSSDNMVQGNVVTENSHNGIVIVGGSENKVVNNLLTNNRDLGIFLSGFTDLNEVHANIVTGIPNRTIGIFVNLGSTQNNIEGNTFLGNFLDMVDQNPDCDDNRWRGNQFDTANQLCIQ